MMAFLKDFLNGEKSPEEKALQAAQNKHDVLIIDSGDEEEVASESCSDEPSSYGGCCGGGCRQ